MFKKILIGLILLVLMGSVVACGGAQVAPTPRPAPAPTPASTPTPAPAPTPRTKAVSVAVFIRDVLERKYKEGDKVIISGTVSKIRYYMNSSGNPDGVGVILPPNKEEVEKMKPVKDKWGRFYLPKSYVVEAYFKGTYWEHGILTAPHFPITVGEKIIVKGEYRGIQPYINSPNRIELENCQLIKVPQR